jgi:hypothetical protein
VTTHGNGSATASVVRLADWAKKRARVPDILARAPDIFDHPDGSAHSLIGPLGCLPCAKIRQEAIDAGEETQASLMRKRIEAGAR